MLCDVMWENSATKLPQFEINLLLKFCKVKKTVSPAPLWDNSRYNKLKKYYINVLTSESKDINNNFVL